MTRTRPTISLFFALTLIGLVGCKQERGDTCIEDDDCEGALVCCKGTIGATERGTCLSVGETCTDPDPVRVDLGPMDLGGPDQGPSDLGTEDAGEADLGADMGSDDAGADMGETDLGSDLGAVDLGLDDLGTDLGLDMGS